MDLSIIIISYNTKNLLKECLTSIHKNVGHIKFEILVVDNNSQDGSPEMMEKHFPRLKLIKNRENKGFASANNVGIKESKGKYLLLLNSDTLVLPGSLEKMVRFMDRTPEAGAVGCKLFNPDGSLQSLGRGRNLKQHGNSEAKEVTWVEGSCLMVRREVVNKVGLMDENFFFYSEDMDWCRRIRLAHWKIFVLPQAKIIHYGGGSIRKWNGEIISQAYQSGYYYVQKHFGKIAEAIYRNVVFVEISTKLFIWASAYLITLGKRKEFAKRVIIYGKVAIANLWKKGKNHPDLN